MGDLLQEILDNHVSIALVGMCKNAGKTTALGQLLRRVRDPAALALTSIGRDGEAVDLVTGTGKPRIYVRKGTVLATAAGLLPACDITREILHVTGTHTPLGPVVVVRARSDGYVQLAGPSTVAQLAGLSGLFRREGAERVIIDGAAGRKSFCSRRLAAATILCTGASCGGDIDTVAEEAAHTCRLMTLPETNHPGLREAAESSRGLLAGKALVPLEETKDLARAIRSQPDNDTRLLYVDGALTDAMARPLLQSGCRLDGLTIAARDPGRFFLSAELFDRLMDKGCVFAVLDAVHLAAVTVNPFSARGPDLDPAAFRERMARAVPVPVINVQEVCHD